MTAVGGVETLGRRRAWRIARGSGVAAGAGGAGGEGEGWSRFEVWLGAITVLDAVAVAAALTVAEVTAAAGAAGVHAASAGLDEWVRLHGGRGALFSGRPCADCRGKGGWIIGGSAIMCGGCHGSGCVSGRVARRAPGGPTVGGTEVVVGD
jgi:hypothetical protein